MKKQNLLKLAMAFLIVGAIPLSGCSDGALPTNGGAPPNNNPSFVQIERLARPAINEGLIFTNDFLNAFNSIPPSADLSDAAAPVRDEAVKTLLATLAVGGGGVTEATAIAGAFLPDVMRIDTSIPPIAVEDPGFIAAFNAKGSPVSGRKLEDDVMDVVLAVVTNTLGGPSPVSDNVSYAGQPGNPAQGHHMLNGAPDFNGPASFPFLAPAN